MRQQASVLCFPSRFYTEPVRVAMFGRDAQPALPISRALLGESGAQSLKDPRGIAVLAAYSPLGKYPLGLVEKLETQELYVPLREAMPLLSGLTLLLVLAGTLLLRHWVRPIVSRIAGERARAAAILDNSLDAFVALDEQRRIIQWNRQAERLFGWTRAEAEGRPAGELVGLDATSLPVGEQAVRLQAELRSKDGGAVPVEVSAAGFLGQEGLATSLFVRDLRDAREREHQLNQTREALVQAQKLDAIGKLTGGVAHDFNNVLQVIGANLQLLEAGASDASRPLVSTALNAVERGAKLSTQLLAFARRQPLQPSPFDANRRIARMDDLLRRSLGERIEIETVLSAGLWTTMADPSQLENVVLNLAINARDAMPGGGKLTIETANCTLDDDYADSEPDVQPGQYVMVAVSDTGSGMPPEVAARAFEPFFTTKPEGAGTGLGLSMAYGFAKQSGGHIRIYSELGHGTTVKLYLPRSLQPEAAAPSEAAPATVVGGSETILVVEDDLAVQASVIRMLQALGYATLRANDAQAALTILQSGARVDLLFTDVVMPGALRSAELAQLARGLQPTIKVLFTSGYTQNSIVHGGRLDPGIELLSKPYRQEELARKVRRLLDDGGPSPAPEAAQPPAPPVQRPVTAATAAALVNAAASEQRRVLLVEDVADLRETTQYLLQMLGAYTVAVGSAEEAEQVLARERFHLLLTDVSLPGRSGIALAQAALRLQPGLRVAFATGHGVGLEVPEEMPHIVLAKPYSIEELQQLLAGSDREALA